MTVLIPVKDWDWTLYTARYWRDEAHFQSGEPPLLERQFIDSHPERFLFGFPEDGFEPEGGWPLSHSTGSPGYASWEPEEEDIRSRLSFVPGRVAGTQVLGAGWVTPLPPGWLGI